MSTSFKFPSILCFSRIAHDEYEAGSISIHQDAVPDPIYALTSFSQTPVIFEAYKGPLRVYSGSSPGCVLVPQSEDGDTQVVHSAIKLPAFKTDRKKQRFEFLIDMDLGSVKLVTHEFDTLHPFEDKQSRTKASFPWKGMEFRWRQVEDSEFFLEMIEAQTSANSWHTVAKATVSKSNFLFNEINQDNTIETPDFATITFVDRVEGLWKNQAEDDVKLFVVTYFQMLLGDILNKDGRLASIMLTRNRNALKEWVSPLARFQLGMYVFGSRKHFGPQKMTAAAGNVYSGRG
ncbi:hypothetical protein BCR33DRAFT_786643 [Rhizoclosmatium globosum]|uniref:Uncharacterized protein n=1 Tax=Rhizoclosmatium globosum TaxID=329046 RepID=A0A1Y2C4E8_9FUNG|nr:hypothetical protein BCR33DRAFT_786643 [Rhizoclosmatium globosum]|eukprot:ORY41912.1 hypothetical protein BCR33DRAFT_786643 [Rhizoclosmatium globosum]